MIEWMTHWYVLPFEAVFLFGCLLTASMLLGGFGGEHDINIDLDTDVDVDVDVGAHTHSHPDFEPHWFLLGWLGVGKAPLSILLQILLLTFGLVGLLVNALAQDLVGSTGLLFPVALGSATVAAVLATHTAGRLFQKYMPTEQPETIERFTGQVGTASSRLTPDALGQVRITTVAPKGTREEIYLLAYSHVPLTRGTEVWLVHYDQKRGAYLATGTDEID